MSSVSVAKSQADSRRFVQILAVLFGCVAFFIAMISTANAQRMPNDFADLVDELLPAVINISTEQQVTGRNGETEDQLSSLGSGFIIDPKGIAVTNHHVIDNADKIFVILSDGREFEADLVGSDKETDIAVLRIQTTERLPSTKFGDSEVVRVGSWVMAIGNPFGLSGSVSAGIVSAKDRDIDAGLFDSFIQTDAAINKGNSGGPLFNMKGEVIGVNTAIYSNSGGSVGVSFSVPSNMAQHVIEQLLEYGETRRGFLGANLRDVRRKDVSEMSLPSRHGALVSSVVPNGPAYEAGLQENDFIVAFADKEVKELRQLTRYIAETNIGKSVKIRLYRNGSYKVAYVKLGHREREANNVQQNLPKGGASFSGYTMQEPSVNVRNSFGLPNGITGVVVTFVDKSIRMHDGDAIRQGDVILEIGDQLVESPEHAATLFEDLKDSSSENVRVKIMRQDRAPEYVYIQP